MSKQLDNPDGASASASSSVGIGTVWRGVRRHPMMSAFFLVGAIVAGAGIWFFLPLPKLTAFVVFQVSAQPQTLLTAVGDARADFNLYCQAQSALVRSRQVLNGALKQPGLANNATLTSQNDKIAWLESKLLVDFKTSPELMRLSLEGDEADDMNAIIEAIKTVYINEVKSKDSNQRNTRLSQLLQVQQKYSLALESYRTKLGGIAEDLGSTDPNNLAVREKFAQERLGAAQRELLTLESEIRRGIVESRKNDEKVKNIEKKEVPKEIVDATIKASPGYQQLLANEATIAESIKRIKAGLVEAARPPAILVSREDDLAKAKKEAQDYIESNREAVTIRLKEMTVVESQRVLTGIQERMSEWGDVKKAIENDIDSITKSLRKASTGQLDVEGIRRDMTRLERTSDMVQQQIEELKPEMDAPARVSVWGEPTVIAGIEGNRRLKYSLMALVGVLVVGMGLITFIEARNRHVVEAKEVTEDLGLRLIGTVPPMPRQTKGSSEAAATQMALWQSVLTESVDSTRTMLVHSLEGAKSGVSIVVTSAMPEEGKTMFASHIASSLARAGFKTLLVDGDMRRPSLNSVLETPLTPGLSELLRGECAPADAIRTCVVKGLSFVPAGEWDVRVSQTLSTDRWRILKTQLSSGFDYVVIDTSPLLLVTDPLLMAQHVDGVVISVLRNVSQIGSVTMARNRLTSLGVKILGVVVNGLDQNGYRPAYYRGYLRSKPAPEAIAAGSESSPPAN